MNHYATLGIDESATRQEVRSAYLRRVQEAHPDRHVGEPQFLDWHDRFKQIHEAYEVLYDDVRRDAYDRQRVLPRPRAKVVVTPRYQSRRKAAEHWRGTPPPRERSNLRWGLTLCPAVFVLGLVALLFTQWTAPQESMGTGWGDEMAGWDEPAARLLPPVGIGTAGGSDGWGDEGEEDLGWGYGDGSEEAYPDDEYYEEPQRSGRQYVFEDEPTLHLLPENGPPHGMPRMNKPPRLDPFVEPASFELGSLLRFPIDPPGAATKAPVFSLGERFPSGLNAGTSTIFKSVPQPATADRTARAPRRTANDWQMGSGGTVDLRERNQKRPLPYAGASSAQEPLHYSSVMGTAPSGWSQGGQTEPVAPPRLPVNLPATPTTGISTPLPPLGEQGPPRSWTKPSTLTSPIR